jgi:chromosomal replication initiator protein
MFAFRIRRLLSFIGYFGRGVSMDIVEAKEIWARVKEELQTLIPESVYGLWVNTLEAGGFDNDNFALLTMHSMAPQLIRPHSKQIRDTFEKVMGREVDFSINYDADFAKKRQKEAQKAQKKEIQEQETDHLTQMQSNANLNLKYRFDNFVVGENSRIAFAVAEAVAKDPAKKYNPLFIYGGSGLGKTHLMQAIGHHILFHKSRLKVKYVKTEEYVNEIIKNLQQGGDRNTRMDKFRQKYRNVDVLLIDDIQFLESKTKTMEEFFHTFDSLLNNNKQVVFTCDRLPSEIPTLPDRLRTRFEMGLVVEILPPDFETRVAIIKNLADNLSQKADFEVFEYIANHFVKNVRELEGAFNKVSAYADIEQTELTLDFAKQILNCESKQTVGIEKVAAAAGEYYGISVADFKSAARSQKISNARHVAVYLVRELTGKSFESIAEFFNKKHPTMLYSYEKIKKEAKTNKELKKSIAEIKKCMTI